MTRGVYVALWPRLMVIVTSFTRLPQRYAMVPVDWTGAAAKTSYAPKSTSVTLITQLKSPCAPVDAAEAIHTTAARAMAHRRAALIAPPRGRIARCRGPRAVPWTPARATRTYTNPDHPERWRCVDRLAGSRSRSPRQRQPVIRLALRPRQA